MSHDTNLIQEAFKEACVQLRNMEVASEGVKFSVAYAKMFDDQLAYMVKTASKLHIKAREAIVESAMNELLMAGYEVKSPIRERVSSDADLAIALLVKSGYKVTDANGRNY